MYTLRNIGYRAKVRIRHSLSWRMVLIALGYSSTLSAGETYPQCFPAESAWNNIELETPLTDNQILKTKVNEHDVTLTFNRFDNYLPQFYGFAFLKKDIPDIPEITVHSTFEETFHNVKLVRLRKNHIAGDDDSRSYRFIPPTQGTWVIYLVAAIHNIPFLEQKNLRISPYVENVRGGSIFSGSSLNLAEPVDYKACVFASEP